MTQTRKKLIYGNCQVFSPDGELMFRCEEKRAKWYLDRNLAIITSNNPFNIKLTFAPKGKGETIDFLKMERYNRCVVCGSENIDTLTKHHIVPYIYRQHFPEKRKDHTSFFVFPICRDCHYVYENQHANQLKESLSKTYSAPITGKFNNKTTIAIKIVKCLMKHGENIPQNKREILENNLKNELNKIDSNTLFNIKNLQEIKEYLESNQGHDISKSHGQVIVEKVSNLDEFEKMWIKHFITSMNPKFMPEYLVKTIENFVL